MLPPACSYHPGGCGCTGCLPRPFVQRAQTARRPPAPVRRNSIGEFGVVCLIAVVIACGWGAYELIMVPTRIWHTTNEYGQQVPSAAAWVAYTVIPLVLMVAVKAALVATGRGKQAPPKYRDPVVAEAACEHPDAIEVESSYHRALGEKRILARWCPDCETQLPAQLPPSPPKPVKPQIWEWRWRCTCGRNGSSTAYTEQDAKILVERSAMAHVDLRPEIRHTWHNEWNRVG